MFLFDFLFVGATADENSREGVRVKVPPALSSQGKVAHRLRAMNGPRDRTTERMDTEGVVFHNGWRKVIASHRRWRRDFNTAAVLPESLSVWTQIFQ